MRLPELVIDEPDARGERLDMRGCGLGCSGGDLHRRLAQHVQDMRGVEASDAIALQDLGDRRLSDAKCFVGRRRDLPQVEQPLRSEIAFEIEHRRKIAPELFAHAVCKAVALGAKIVGNARPLPQFNGISGIGTAARRRSQRRSVRKAEAITSASRLSSLAPASVKRSRKRSICFGLMA